MKKLTVLVAPIVAALPGRYAYAANGDRAVNGTLNVGANGVKFLDGSAQTTAFRKNYR